MDNKKKRFTESSDEDRSPKDTPPKKRKGSGEQRSESEKRALHRERVRINEQKRRERVKDYFATLKDLLPNDQKNSEMTKEEILLQAIQMLQDSKNQNPEKPSTSPSSPSRSLSLIEVSETFWFVHRDLHQKINTVTNSSLSSTTGLSNYLCELAQRSQNPVFVLHAQTAQLMIYTFISFNPNICLSILETLMPLYDRLSGEEEKLIRVEPALGCSEWVLPIYSMILASIGKFDMSIAVEKRALKMAAKHREIAGVVYSCLHFIRNLRGETLSISEALEACKSMKQFPQFNGLANLTFGLSLIQQGQSIQDRMEGQAIIEQSEVTTSGPYFDIHARVLMIESLQVLNPEKALRDIEEAMIYTEASGKTGCFTKADFLRMKADTLMRMRQDSVEDYMMSQLGAERLYQESMTIASTLGLFSCTLKCALALCKMWKAHGRSELTGMGHFLLQLLMKLEKENVIGDASLMKNAREFLATIVKIEIV